MGCDQSNAFMDGFAMMTVDTMTLPRSACGNVMMVSVCAACVWTPNKVRAEAG